MKRIVRYYPHTHDMHTLAKMMERFVEPETENTVPSWTLALDVVEHEDAFTVQASVPGVNPDAIDITFEKNVLTIQGEREMSDEINANDYRIRERCPGKFGRSIRFNTEINPEAIEASYQYGVLTLTVPKAETVKPKKITVAVN